MPVARAAARMRYVTSRILIVDDSPHFCITAAGLLAARGFEVLESAADGERSASRAWQRMPDGILRDINLPGSTGGAAARLAAAAPPPIVLTPAERARCLPSAEGLPAIASSQAELASDPARSSGFSLRRSGAGTGGQGPGVLIKEVQAELVENARHARSMAATVTTSSRAMPRFERLRAIERHHLRSRGVRSSTGLAFRLRPTSRATTSGSSADPPSATRRTASVKMARSPTFSFSM